MVQHRQIVMFSGGAASYCAAKRVVEAHGPDATTLLFTDTKMEDPDLYRFLEEAAGFLDCPVVNIADGRDPWQVFFDVKFLGNTRIDPCSRILKRELARKWMEDNCEPEASRVIIGFGWDEGSRVWDTVENWKPFQVDVPLSGPPYLDKSHMLQIIRDDGMEPPKLYESGAMHNNCGGFCIKAGQAQFKWLLDNFPDRYSYHECKEQALRDYLQKDVAILRDRRKVCPKCQSKEAMDTSTDEKKLWTCFGCGHLYAKTRPLTMRDFRLRLMAGGEYDELEWGGCGCFAAAS